MSETNSERHFFASSVMSWVADQHLDECLKRLVKADRGSGFEGHTVESEWEYNLWEVPGPSASHYQINNYAPQVEGAKFIGKYYHK